MLASVRQFIRTHRRTTVLRQVASAAEKYLRAYYNEGFYDFARNGEQFVVESFANWIGKRPCTVWDVGANHGHWTRMVHRLLPHARVVSFEIIGEVADSLIDGARDTDWWSVEKCGLSDSEGIVKVSWNRQHDSTSSIAPNVNSPFYFPAKVERIDCPVTTVDTYLRAGHPAPDFLKIDVEGHDAAVLEGASQLLGSPEAPVLIQFEYGGTWIPHSRMLGPIQSLLEEVGYSVGRVFPNYVDFKPYTTREERFRMGNMAAVRDPSLKDMLSGLRTA